MEHKALSPREEQLVDLAVRGYTNDGIARELGISINTVNTYWVRIRMKVEGDGRTAVVANLIREKAELALRASNVQKIDLAAEIASREHQLLDLRGALSLLQLAMDQLRSAVWATDANLQVSIIANGEIPHFHDKMNWKVGNSIYQVANSKDPKNPLVAAHLRALSGEDVSSLFPMNGEKLTMLVRPLRDENDEVVGCIGVLISLAGSGPVA